MIINPYAFGNPVCVFPLNATAGEIAGVGLDGKLAMTNGEMTGTYTIQSGLGASETYGAGSLVAIDYADGIKATEYTFSLPTITGGAGTAAITITASLDENPFSGLAPIRVKAIANDDGTFSAYVLVDNVTAYTGACSATGRFTIIANGDTGNVVVKLNGVALTLSDSTYVMQDALLTCSVQEAIGLNVAYLGQTASITTIVDHNAMLYATGFDICGNQIIIPQGITFTSASDGTSTDITDAGQLWTIRTSALNTTWQKAEVDSAKTTGKWYYEVEVDWTMLIDSREPAIGIAPEGTSTTSSEGGSNNAGNGGRIQYFASGEKRQSGTYAAYGATYQDGDIIGIAFDGDARTITAYKNGVSQGVMYSGIAAGPFVPHFCRYHAVTGGGFRLKSSLLYLPSGYNVWT